MIRTIFTIILLSAFTMLMAQKESEIGLNFGVATYQGDLAVGPFNAKQINPSVGVVYRKLFTPRIALRASATWCQISGSDLDFGRVERGLEFQSGLLEFAVNGEWHPMGRARFTNQGFFTRSFSPYVSLGAGITFGGADVDVVTDEGKYIPEDREASSFFVMPIHLGVRLDVSESWTVTLDAGARPTFSDLLDGVSINNNNGTDKNKDWYLTAGVTVLYTFEAENGSFDY